MSRIGKNRMTVILEGGRSDVHLEVGMFEFSFKTRAASMKVFSITFVISQ